MRCKPNDLAVIVGCVVHTENNGKLVTVIRHSWLPGFDWYVESAGSPLLGRLGYSTGSNCLDCNLRPIRPQPDEAIDEMLRDVPVDVGGCEVLTEGA